MKLISIKMYNFRQFYGEQTIEFAQDDKNITIVFGENGKGKTGIFRALMFGLYGSLHIQQDDEKEKVHLVNQLALKENAPLPTDAYVEVQFAYDNEVYTIKRILAGLANYDVITESVKSVSVSKIDEQGNFIGDLYTDSKDVAALVNEVMSEQIKDLFLFDAEKIETLAKTDLRARRETKQGIVNLLQIDKLERAIDIIKKVDKKETQLLKTRSNQIEITTIEQELETLQNQYEQLQETTALKTANLEACQAEIAETVKILSENEEIRKIYDEIKNLKERRKGLEAQALIHRQGMKVKLVSESPALLLKDNFVNVSNYLEQLMVDQKDLISIDVIERSIREKVCACCNNDLEIHSANLRYVEQLRNNYKRSELTPLISQITNSIHDFNQKETDVTGEIEEKLASYRAVKDEIERINYELDTKEKLVSTTAKTMDNIKELESKLADKRKEAMKLEFEISQIDEEKVKNDIKNKKQKLNEELKKDESLRQNAKMLEYLELLRERFEVILTEYSTEMRRNVAQQTAEIFRTLIDPKDRDLIKSVEINEKYEISIFNWNNIKSTQDVSQGQRQVVALSFITALAKVAGKDNSKINFPLFMDTPFGRISGNNRDHLIDNIPHLTSQWVLLLTDTEMSRVEEQRFKATGKLGKWYKLDQIRPGHTNIVEYSTDETMTTRG